jgi:hypothetical protein
VVLPALLQVPLGAGLGVAAGKIWIVRREKEMKDHESAFPVMDATRANSDGSPYSDYACSDPGMTKYEYAAIHLKVPRSGDPDIDAMIRESVRKDFIEAAFAVVPISDNDAVTLGHEQVAKIILRFVDTMLEEWEKEAGK